MYYFLTLANNVIVESLTELIQAANNHDIEFVYAISPGLDITYSSNKDVTILRRKLDQASLLMSPVALISFEILLCRSAAILES